MTHSDSPSLPYAWKQQWSLQLFKMCCLTSKERERENNERTFFWLGYPSNDYWKKKAEPHLEDDCPLNKNSISSIEVSFLLLVCLLLWRLSCTVLCMFNGFQQLSDWDGPCTLWGGWQNVVSQKVHWDKQSLSFGDFFDNYRHLL